MRIQSVTFTKISILLVLGLCLSSCTALQWRSSDQEIKEKFEESYVNADISYFKVDSLNLKVRIQAVTEPDNSINLIFFHGSPSSLSAWDAYALDSTLREKANIYAIDRPGYGYSDFGNEMTSIQLQAQIMSALIKQKELKNVLTIGSSYGGPLAARIGYLNENVKAIVMISPAIDPENENDIWASRFTRWKLTRWLVPTSYRVAGDEKKVHAQELALIKDDWVKMTIPVYHLHGDKDDIVPYQNIEFTKKNFPNHKIVSFPERGHEIAWKNPDLIIPYLVELINSLLVKNTN